MFVVLGEHSFGFWVSGAQGLGVLGWVGQLNV